MASSALFCVLLVGLITLTSCTTRPMIGIITEPSPDELSEYGSEFLVASYVKYVESGGARVVPVRCA